MPAPYFRILASSARCSVVMIPMSRNDSSPDLVAGDLAEAEIGIPLAVDVEVLESRPLRVDHVDEHEVVAVLPAVRVLEGIDEVDNIAPAGKDGNVQVADLQLQFRVAPLEAMAG